MPPACRTWANGRKKDDDALLRLARIEKLPEDQRVAGLDRLQAGGQPRASIVAARCQVLVDAGRDRRRPPASRPAAAPASGCRPTWRHGHSQSASQLREEPQERRSPPCKLAINSATGFLADCGDGWPAEYRRQETARFPSGSASSPVAFLRLTHFASSRSISRPSHRSCAQSQTACVGITLQSQLMCAGNRT